MAILRQYINNNDNKPKYFHNQTSFPKNQYMCISKTTSSISSQHYSFFYPLAFYLFLSIVLLYSLYFPILSVYAQTNGGNGLEETIEGSSKNPTPKLKRITPSLDWFLDPSGQLTIEQILSPGIQRSFSSFLFTKPPKKEGTFWFRFTLDSTTRLILPNLILDLNKRIPSQIPKQNNVWVSSMGSEKSRLLKPINEHTYAIKYSGSEIIDVYIQMPGAPGIGFSPILWSKQYFSNSYSFATSVTYFLLLSIIIICIARGIIEKQEWRIWSTLYVGAIFINIVWGLPQTPKGILTIWDMPGLLSPGIALFILPHIGRSLMQTQQISPTLDTQLLLLRFPGIILSLLPLLPGYLWIIPYLSLWPLVTILFLPTVLFATTQNIKKAKTFLSICITIPFSLFPLIIPTSIIPEQIPIGIINSIPLLLLNLSCIIIALTNNPKAIPMIRRQLSPKLEKTLIAFQSEHLNSNLLQEQFSPQFENLEQKLQLSLNRITKEIANLNVSLNATSLQQHVEAIESTAEYLNHVIHGAPELFIPNLHPKEETFDLTQLFLNVHKTVEKEAEEKNLALSWFIEPHLPKKYKGNRLQLTQVLYLLLESAVHATNKGIIQLRAQRVPDSTNPGHLLITISDSGESSPHINRSSLALIHAWEFIHATGETLNIESKPTGTNFSFSVKLCPAQITHTVTETQISQKIPLNEIQPILIADTSLQQREILTYYLDELPYEIIEANTSNNIYEAYKNTLSSLIIFGSEMPENDIIESIGAIRVFEGEHNFPPAPILALCKTNIQAEKLTRVGCTHILVEPISRKELRQLVLCLAPISQRVQHLFNTNTQMISNQQNEENRPLSYVTSTLYKKIYNTTSPSVNVNEKEQDTHLNTKEAFQNLQNIAIDQKDIGRKIDTKNCHQYLSTTIPTQYSFLATTESDRPKEKQERIKESLSSSINTSVQYPPLEKPQANDNNLLNTQDIRPNFTGEKKLSDTSQELKEKQDNNTTNNKEKQKTTPNKKKQKIAQHTIKKNKTSLPLLDIISVNLPDEKEPLLKDYNIPSEKTSEKENSISLTLDLIEIVEDPKRIDIIPFNK